MLRNWRSFAPLRWDEKANPLNAVSVIGSANQYGLEAQRKEIGRGEFYQRAEQKSVEGNGSGLG
jgi:hypothetical protein